MRLRPITVDDLPLYERALTSPEMMAGLGGPLPRDRLKEKLESIVRDVEAGSTWFDVIETDDGEPAGWVCIWSHDKEGEPISEIGWMVLPDFQGSGLATGAVRSHLERARNEGRWGEIRAYPAVTNEPSNAICRKTGFTHVGQHEGEYMGRRILSNDWRIDVQRSG